MTVHQFFNPRNRENVPNKDQTTRIVPDSETLIQTVIEGNETLGFKEVGPLVQGIIPVGSTGNIGKVTDDGELLVADYSPGTAVYGYDAAGENTYILVCATEHRCRNMLVTVATKACIVSIDGGVHDFGAFMPGTTTPVGQLDIPAGTGIYAKNETADMNYATLHISVW